MSGLVQREGSLTAEEIYMAVGVALSWWEASEDMLMGLFGWLCGATEPTAFETYVAASRSARTKMMSSALVRYEARFLPDEVLLIRSSMRALEKLASVRNQIAHGHVVNVSTVRDDVLTMEGNFLVPSLNERGRHIARDLRYAHSASEIDAWCIQVRHERGRVMDSMLAAQLRDQAQRAALSPEAQMTVAISEAIAARKISSEGYVVVATPADTPPINRMPSLISRTGLCQ